METFKDIKIKPNELRKILLSDPSYLRGLVNRKRVKRREWRQNSVGYLFQADLGMFPRDSNGFKYFLVVIDIGSRFIWSQKFKTKTAQNVKKELKAIFAIHRPAMFQSDAGSEFIGLKEWFKAQKVKFQIKSGANKASFAENAIKNLKRRMQYWMRSENTTDWSNYLEKATDSYNNSPHPGIGLLIPAKVNSPFFDHIITKALEKRGGHTIDRNWKEQLLHQKKFLKSDKSLKPGQIVMLDHSEKPPVYPVYAFGDYVSILKCSLSRAF